MLVIDWILNGEDQIFHVVLAVAMAGPRRSERRRRG
jgi:hypothetical protein